MNELLQTTKEITDYKEMEMLMKYCEIISKAPAYAAMGGMPGIGSIMGAAGWLTPVMLSGLGLGAGIYAAKKAI